MYASLLATPVAAKATAQRTLSGLQHKRPCSACCGRKPCSNLQPSQLGAGRQCHGNSARACPNPPDSSTSLPKTERAGSRGSLPAHIPCCHRDNWSLSTLSFPALILSSPGTLAQSDCVSSLLSTFQCHPRRELALDTIAYRNLRQAKPPRRGTNL